MGSKSNIQGRAYEYACLKSIFNLTSKIRNVRIIEDNNYLVCKKNWESLSDFEKEEYILSSDAAARQILELEPRISDPEDGILDIYLQPDSKGEEGDVRDIIVLKGSINWEIGLSVKHNNFAVKHSRLGVSLDFGKSWFGVPCSQEYWNDIKPIFDSLSEKKSQGLLFSQLTDKEDNYYVPLLKAFMKELKTLMGNGQNIPAKLVEYLLGRYDFYKVISVDAQRYTCIQAVNIHKSLNLPSHDRRSELFIPNVKLPSRLIHIGFVPESKTTLELYLDGGWQFTFRIHNAASKVEPSLKFDIKIIGMPTTVITINSYWEC